MKHLRTVVLQDAAVLPQDPVCSWYAHLWTASFCDSRVQGVLRNNAKLTRPNGKPSLDASIEAVLPGVQEHLSAMVTDTSEMRC